MAPTCTTNFLPNSSFEMAGPMQLRCKSMNDLTAVDFSGSNFAANVTESRDSGAATPRLSVKRSRGRQTGCINVKVIGTPLSTRASALVCPGAPVKSKGTFKVFATSRKPLSRGFIRRLDFSLLESDSAISISTGNSNSSTAMTLPESH